MIALGALQATLADQIVEGELAAEGTLRLQYGLLRCKGLWDSLGRFGLLLLLWLGMSTLSRGRLAVSGSACTLLLARQPGRDVDHWGLVGLLWRLRALGLIDLVTLLVYWHVVFLEVDLGDHMLLLIHQTERLLSGDTDI